MPEFRNLRKTWRGWKYVAKKECTEWPACALRLRECEFFTVVQMLREGGSFSDSQDEEAGGFEGSFTFLFWIKRLFSHGFRLLTWLLRGTWMRLMALMLVQSLS